MGSSSDACFLNSLVAAVERFRAQPFPAPYYIFSLNMAQAERIYHQLEDLSIELGGLPVVSLSSSCASSCSLYLTQLAHS